ncbi:hypothetical protein, partial [Escherichia coli]|uniref:hypothetical protein n=1 Tax=Escherichia coli TaxID=562 RepID=UPI001BDC49B2
AQGEIYLSENSLQQKVFGQQNTKLFWTVGVQETMTLHTTPCNGFYIITKPVLQESYGHD